MFYHHPAQYALNLSPILSSLLISDGFCIDDLVLEYLNQNPSKNQTILEKLFDNDLVVKLNTHLEDGQGHRSEMLIDKSYFSPSEIKNSIQSMSLVYMASVQELIKSKIPEHEMSIISTGFRESIIEVIRKKYGEKLFLFEGEKTRESGPVVGVTLGKLPIVQSDFNIDHLLDFKADPDTKLKLAALRNWMVDMNKAQYTRAEIEDKFQYLYHQYIDHMDRAKIKYTLEGGEFWITAIEEIVNDMSSMKFGSAAKAVFSIGKRHLKLLEEERKAPGKELAFIYKARKEFEG